MVTFSVPQRAGGGRPFRFSVEERTVLVAGSRHRSLEPQLCRDVAQGFSRLGFGFFVGCAAGVDQSFRTMLADSPWREDTWVGCAFRSRARTGPASGSGCLCGVSARPVARRGALPPYALDGAPLHGGRAVARAAAGPGLGSRIPPGAALLHGQPQTGVRGRRASPTGACGLPGSSGGPLWSAPRLLGSGRSLRGGRLLR